MDGIALGVVNNCRWEGRGQGLLFEMSSMVPCDFEKRSQNPHFQKTWYGGVRKKEHFVYALDNIDNSG